MSKVFSSNALPLVLALMFLFSRPAAAMSTPVGQYGYGYGYGYGFAPPVVMVRDPSMLIFKDQYYDVNVSGLRRLCDENPDMCASEAQQARLSSLRSHDIWSYVLGGIGLAAMLAAPVFLVTQPCENIACHRNIIPAGVSAGSGVVLLVAAAIVRPGSDDCVGFVNSTNRLHPESPIKLQVGIDGHGRATAGFSARF